MWNNIYCSKDFYFNGYDKILFHEGQSYEYFFEDKDTIWINYDKDGKPGFQGWRFFLDSQRGNIKKFNEYFDPNELRRKKLEKINMISENDV